MQLEDRMRHHRVPGLSLALIDDFEISWAKGYGSKEAGQNRPVSTQTLFQTASIGKPVTAVAALQLVEAGSLDLDADVNAKLRSWRIPENDFTRQAAVTLRGLLSHSAGMSVSGFAGYGRGTSIPSLLQILDGEAPANSAPIRVDALPGSRYRYSGGGYMVIQQLLEDLAERPFAEFIAAVIFAPSGMVDSAYAPLPEGRWPQAASGHQGDGRSLEGRWHVYPEKGAGPFWSTPSDMARFGIELMRAHEGQSERLLSRAMAREMLTPQIEAFGLGILVGDDGGDRFYAMHLGANAGYRSLLVLYPMRGQGAVIMTNGDGGEELARELLNSISREYGWVSGFVLEVWMVLVAAAVVLPGVLLLLRRRASSCRGDSEHRSCEVQAGEDAGQLRP
jgi:CubicO group peptidase (beta-lactamase class C family)